MIKPDKIKTEILGLDNAVFGAECKRISVEISHGVFVNLAIDADNQEVTLAVNNRPVVEINSLSKLEDVMELFRIAREIMEE